MGMSCKHVQYMSFLRFLIFSFFGQVVNKRVGKMVINPCEFESRPPATA